MLPASGSIQGLPFVLGADGTVLHRFLPAANSGTFYAIDGSTGAVKVDHKYTTGFRSIPRHHSTQITPSISRHGEEISTR